MTVPEVTFYDELPFRQIPLQGAETTILTNPQSNDTGGATVCTPDPAPVATHPHEQQTPTTEQQPPNTKHRTPNHEPHPHHTKPVTPPQGVVSSMELRNAEFQPFGLSGEWHEHLGDVMVPFSMMVFGRPGSGKSTYCLKLAYHCAANMGKNVLYVGGEESYVDENGETKFAPTMKEKFDRLNVYHENLHLTPELPDELDENYDVVFLDSVHALQIGPEEMDDLIRETRENKTGLIFIFHSTKEGQYRGATTNEHLIDVSVKLDSGVTSFNKNRFGGNKKMYAFEQ